MTPRQATFSPPGGPAAYQNLLLLRLGREMGYAGDPSLPFPFRPVCTSRGKADR